MSLVVWQIYDLSQLFNSSSVIYSSSVQLRFSFSGLYYKHIHGHLSVITDKCPEFFTLVFSP